MKTNSIDRRSAFVADDDPLTGCETGNTFETMRLSILHYTCMSLASGLVVALAGPSAYAQEGNESDAAVTPRSPLLYVDLPVQIIDGIDPVLPPVARPLDPEADPNFAQRVNSIEQYSSTVVEIEQIGGAWDDNLVEELSALGRLQQQQGDHLAAIETFDRALHVNRINSGLYTLEQVSVVEQLIQSYMALGEWEQVDTYNNYLYHVQQKAFGSDDPRLIPVLDRLATWHIQAFNIGFGNLQGVRLRQAQIMFNAAARMVGIHFGKTDERFANYQRNIARSAYLVARNPDLMMEIDRPEYRSAQQMLADQLNMQRPVQPPGFRTGERALLEVVQLYMQEDYDAYLLAEAITHLGDWYLMFNRRGAALDNYRRAWEVLEGQENSEELTERLFGKVVPLPAFSSSIKTPEAFYLNEDGTESLQFDFTDLIFDVTANGMVRNIESLSEETVANEGQLSKLRIWVRSTRFRPRIEDGEPVRVNENHFRYRYWY